MKWQFGFCAFKSAFLVLILSISAIAAPAELPSVSVREHLGEKLDLALQFVDSADRQKHALGAYFKNGKPTILNLVYFECPMLCTLLLNGVSDGMKGMDWAVGDQFNVLTISIDPKDDSNIAEQKRNAYITNYSEAKARGPAHSEALAKAGWHFFTGDEATIKKLAAQLGFNYEYDQLQQQYSHPAVTFFITPEGVISRYLYGIAYPPKELRMALVESSDGQLGSFFDRVKLFFYRYDSKTREYSLKSIRDLF